MILLTLVKGKIVQNCITVKTAELYVCANISHTNNFAEPIIMSRLVMPPGWLAVIETIGSLTGDDNLPI